MQTHTDRRSDLPLYDAMYSIRLQKAKPSWFER
jgi:hypothetical protein